MRTKSSKAARTLTSPWALHHAQMFGCPARQREQHQALQARLSGARIREARWEEWLAHVRYQSVGVG